uniref:Tetraspanin n=1 Tax=Oncorhynchus tshawytscha TaxID=74940 RepID=A0A8C8JPM0_ONCTS
MMSGKHFKAHEVSCCIKYFIFGFNIIFWLLGVAFLGIGLWAWSEKGVLSNISSITDLGGFDPVWLFLVVGGVMFILGFAGCIGALRENSFLLKFFSVFLGIIFFLELTAGVLAFVFKDWIKDQLNFFINNNIRAYRDDIDLQNLIDFTQEYWECCGAFGADDWNLNIYFNCTDSNPSREKCGVPFSCCTKDPAEDVINTQCGYDIRAKAVSEQRTFIYIKGCVPQFEKWLQDNLTVVAGIFIGIALLQIFGICLAQNLVSDIEVVRESWPELSVSSHPHTSPFSLGNRELTTVSLKVAEDSPLCHKPRVIRSSARFGVPSHSPFFCRNNPHPQRVRHIKGINDKQICAVNDVTFGQFPQYCLGRVLTLEKNLVLQSNIPTAAIGTNSTYLPIDVLTGLQFFPLKQTDSPSLRLLTKAWREELRELTERAGLLGAGGRGSGVAFFPQSSCVSALGGSRDDREGNLKLQLMVIDMLCQILQTESIGDVQQWILTAGQREKDQILSLLSSALAKDPVSAYEAPGREQLTVKEVQNLPPASRMASISEEDTARDHSLEIMPNCDLGKLEDAGTERAESKTHRQRHIARPLSTQRTLCSPTVCHLNQKVVLRYTKRALMPHTPPEVFQAEWPNYTQQAPGSLVT